MRFTVGTVLAVLIGTAATAPAPIVACDAGPELDPRYLIVTDVDYNKAHLKDSKSQGIDSRAPHDGENSESPLGGLFQPSRIQNREPRAEPGLGDKLEPGSGSTIGLNPLNAYTGPTTIHAGTLQLGESNGLPDVDGLLQIDDIIVK
ncbi:hypothetical protein B0T11DRAFT_358732 [Plectosphaerella cucumerina]|uniref:Uncharacterized protein n=1 Tax=Plectosphaerella cucumerina TaxID=40658 RepID=A0A8K0T657_9PEZI|nr:hypothetical protein B0T11DRAFT_358732 [Plectosphaerella cucumerina]